MKNKLILASLILLTGCATQEQVRYETVRVEVPIPVVCKTPDPEKPQYNFDKLKPEDTIHDKVKALLADRLLKEAYEKELEAALKSCK